MIFYSHLVMHVQQMHVHKGFLKKNQRAAGSGARPSAAPAECEDADYLYVLRGGLSISWLPWLLCIITVTHQVTRWQ